jgi:hypothetical protein
MSDTENDKGSEEAGDEIQSVVKEFEDILAVVPDDQVALETLAYIYEHIGERSKSDEYLVQLGRVIVDEGDAHLAGYVYERLDEAGLCDGTDSDVCDLVKRLITTKESAGDDTYGDSAASGASVSFKVMDELSFAWHVFQAGQLTQDEYSDVAGDLAEMTADRHLSTISTLQVLEARAFSGMERLMGFVARDSKTPIVSLPMFDIPEELHSILPLDFMIRYGVIVYGLLAEDALVVVMNPLNMELRRHIENQLQRTCHYYISMPSEFDAVIRSISGSEKKG